MKQSKQATSLAIGSVILVVAVSLIVMIWLKFPAARIVEQDDVQRVFHRAEAAINRNHLARARQLLEECLELDPDHSMAKVYLGQILREAGDVKRATDYWRAVHEQDTEAFAMARFLEGTVSMEEGDVAASRDRFREAVRADPNHLGALSKLVLVDRMLRRPQRLVEQLNHLAGLRELSLEELVFHTVPHQSGYPPEESIATLQTALQSHPDDSELQVAFVEVLLENRQAERARQYLDGLSPTAMENTELMAQSILTDLDLGRVQQALKQCESLQNISTTSLRLHEACGEAAYRAERWGTAAKSLCWSVARDGDHRDHCFQLGICFERLGMTQPARELIERSVKLDELERLCLRITRDVQAINPQFLPMVRQIIELLIQLQRSDDARAWCRFAFTLAPDDAAVRSLLQTVDEQATEQFQFQAEEYLSVLSEQSLMDSPSAITPQVPEADARIVPLQFADVYKQAGLDFQYFNGQSGVEHLIESMGGGVLVIDFDGDGYEDLYFPQGSAITDLPSSNHESDRLFQNLSGKRFEDVSELAGIDSPRYGLGGTSFDYNNDGFDDLMISNMGVNEFYFNNGDGTFTEVGVEIGLYDEEMSTSAVAADFNNDSLLDLFVTNYVSSLKTCPQPDGSYRPCDPASFEGQPDRLYLNNGQGSLIDVSSAAGINLPNGKGLGVVAADLDDDRDIDIYVANDGVPNFLFENITEAGSNSPAFLERGLVSGSALDAAGRAQAGMGVAIADFNRDQQLDLYVTNFYLEHNTLYSNQGNLLFNDATRRFGLYEPTLPVLGFGVQASDFDADGDADILVANGHIFHDRTGRQPWKMQAQCFVNSGKAQFSDATANAGAYFQTPSLGRGVATFDWNRDGAQDAVIVHQDRNVALLQNQTPQQSLRLRLKLIGTISNRNGEAAVLFKRLDENSRVRLLQEGGNYLSCNSRERDILVADDASLNLEIEWPSGELSSHSLEKETLLQFSSGSGCVWHLTEAGQTFVTAKYPFERPQLK